MTTQPTASISELTFSGGDSFQLNKNEKIILVGPNNSGKSQTLREIIRICNDGKIEQAIVIKSLTISKEGTSDDLKAFLDEKAEYVNVSYRYKNWQIHENHIRFWDQAYLINNLSGGFIKNVDANNRLNI